MVVQHCEYAKVQLPKDFRNSWYYHIPQVSVSLLVSIHSMLPFKKGRMPLFSIECKTWEGGVGGW